MDYIVVCIVSFFAAGLTLFSGFGLGTILLPAFAFFFPLPLAVAATAIVHLVNNIFKGFLVGRDANWQVVARFSIPAATAGVLGALLLDWFAVIPPIATYTLGGATRSVLLVNLVIGVLIIIFALLELLPAFQRLAFDQRWLPVGGALSGFFGGLSGHQGALRSAFLIKAGLARDAFIGTGVVSAIIVDMVRLLVYGAGFYLVNFEMLAGTGSLVLAACLAALAGSFISARLVKKVTLRSLQVVVAVMLALIGAGMAGGLL